MSICLGRPIDNRPQVDNLPHMARCSVARARPIDNRPQVDNLPHIRIVAGCEEVQL